MDWWAIASEAAGVIALAAAINIPIAAILMLLAGPKKVDQR